MQYLESLRQALEELESMLLEFEEALEGEELVGRDTVRPRCAPEPGGTTGPLDPEGLPSARNGRELGLPQAEGGDTQYKAGSFQKGKAHRPRRVL